MTPARIAVATALTQTSSSEPSSTPPPSHKPSIRQTSLGRKPAITSTSSACQSPRKWLIGALESDSTGLNQTRASFRFEHDLFGKPGSLFRIMLSPPVNAIGDGAGRHAADQDIDAGVQGGRHRKQRQSQYQRQDVGKLPAVARGRKQKCQRRQQQDRGSKQLWQIGCEAVANRIGNE